MASVVIFGADGRIGGQLVPCAVGSFFVHGVTRTGGQKCVFPSLPG